VVLVSSCNLLLAFTSTVIFGFRHCGTHDRIFLSHDHLFGPTLFRFWINCYWLCQQSFLVPGPETQGQTLLSQLWVSHETDSWPSPVCVTDKLLLALASSHSWFWAPQDPWPIFFCLMTRLSTVPPYNFSMDHIGNTISSSFSIVVHIFVAVGTCLPRLCVALDISSGSVILAFKHHVA
jgi:hypothetical protein